MLHAFGMNQDLIFLDISSQHGNLCHTSGGKQTRTDRPVGHRTEIEHGRAVCRQSDNQQFSQNGRLGTQCRLAYIVRQSVVYSRQFLGNNLAGQVNIRIPVELNPYDREAGSRRRTHPANTSCTVYSRFNRESNQLFYFLSCHTIGLGHDHYRRSIQIRKDINFGMERHIRSADQQQDGCHQNQQAVLKRKMYNLVQHRFRN